MRSAGNFAEAPAPPARISDKTFEMIGYSSGLPGPFGRQKKVRPPQKIPPPPNYPTLTKSVPRQDVLVSA
jgi:hypothetical protein